MIKRTTTSFISLLVPSFVLTGFSVTLLNRLPVCNAIRSAVLVVKINAQLAIRHTSWILMAIVFSVVRIVLLVLLIKTAYSARKVLSKPTNPMNV